MILITFLFVISLAKQNDGPLGGNSGVYFQNVVTNVDCKGSGWDTVNYGLNGTRAGSEGMFLDMKCFIRVKTEDGHQCERSWEYDGDKYFGCDSRVDSYKGNKWCKHGSSKSEWDYCDADDVAFYCVGSDMKASSPHRDHRMQCGYSYMPANEIEDNQLVLSDLKMFVCNENNDQPGQPEHMQYNACDCPTEGNWHRTMTIDSWKNLGTNGERGEFAVLCAKRELYGKLQSKGKELITEVGVLLKNDVIDGREVIGTHAGRWGNRKYWGNQQQGRETRDHDALRFYIEKEKVEGAKKDLFSKTYGIWKISQSGNGGGSRSIGRSMEFSKGFSKSTEDSVSFATSISHQASIELTTGYDFAAGPKVEATVGYSFNHETSREATRAVGNLAEKSISSTTDDSCSIDVPDWAGEAESEWVMWVFEIVREGTGSNEGLQASQEMCTAFFKTGKCKNSPPRCVPGHCVGRECATCDREDMEMNQDYDLCETEFDLFQDFNIDAIHSQFDTVFGMFQKGGMSWLSFALLLLLLTTVFLIVCCCCCRRRVKHDDALCCVC